MIAWKFRDIWRIYLHADSKSGYDFWDLYQMMWIDEFKQNVEKYPIRKEDTSLVDADVFVIWDSFAWTNFWSDRLANFIEDESDLSVRYLWDIDVWFLDPVKYFERTWFLQKVWNKNNVKQRFLVLESVERYTWNRWMKYWKYNEDDVVWSQNKWLVLLKNNIWSLKDDIEDVLFDFEFVNYFWRNNFVFFPVYHWIQNQRWRFFGWKSDKVMIGTWKMLFYREGIEFAQMKKGDDDIHKLAENISILDKELNEKYDLNLIYIAIPDKLTIYPEYYDSNWKYDEYLPRLQLELENFGVEYIDVYNLFLGYKKEYPEDLLYYLSDTHYTSIWKKILVDAINNKR